MDRAAKKKYPDAVLLLRKSQGSGQVPVLKSDEFPIRFEVEGRTYRIDRTRAGKVLMTKENIGA
jgi:hypothetical protein